MKLAEPAEILVALALAPGPDGEAPRALLVELPESEAGVRNPIDAVAEPGQEGALPGELLVRERDAAGPAGRCRRLRLRDPALRIYLARDLRLLWADGQLRP